MRSEWDDRLAPAIGWVAVLWLALALIVPAPVEAPTPRAIVAADSARRVAADGVVVAVANTDTVTQQVVHLLAVARARAARVRAQVPTVTDSTPADTATLAHFAAESYRLASTVDLLAATVDSLVVAHEAERAAWRVTLAAADRQLDAERQARLAAQAAAVCKVGPVPCPTRRTAFVLGFAAAVAVIVVR